MTFFYKEILFYLILLVVALILLAKNPFVGWKQAVVRLVIGTGVGWGLLVHRTLWIYESDRRRAVTVEEIREVTGSDGAPTAFVILFGWLLPLAWQLALWVCVVVTRRLRPAATKEELVVGAGE